MERIYLKELVNTLDVEVNREVQNEEFIDSICTDTRKDVCGSLFVALKGQNFDGHDFVKTAIENGAKAILVDSNFKKDVGNILVLKAKDMPKTLMQIANYYRNMLKITVVGITGSVGKTSTKDMIACVLSEQYKVIKTPENLNNEIGVFSTIMSAGYKDEIAVIEMGMCNLGEIELLSCGVEPDIAVITKIGVTHIESLKTRENIFKAKMEITRGLKLNGLLVLNADDDYLKNVKSTEFKVMFYGIRNEHADVWGSEAKFNELTGTEFYVNTNMAKIKAFLPALGEHNVSNALAAYCVGKELKMTDEQIINGFKNYVSSGARQKLVEKDGGTYVLDYYNANPDSVKAAVQTLCTTAKSCKKIFIFADMNELGSISDSAHKEIGEFMAKMNVDVLLCVGNKSKLTVEAAQKAKINIAMWFSTKADLIKKLKEITQPGSVVWIKGSRSMKLEEVADEVILK